MPRKTKRTTTRGRPRIENPAVLRLNVRITEEQRERYGAAADAKGLTLTAWVEKLLDRAAPPAR